MTEHDFSWANGVVLLDRTNDENDLDISYPFALDELLGRQVGEGGPPVCHLWRHPSAFIIGSRDSRLPGTAHALHWLETQGYSTLVRNSGGAAVPLDQGVVNLSLILPLQLSQEHGLHFDFERMYALIQHTLASFGCTVEKGEVQGAYCPGEYDLHIKGRKFCGIAQRRLVRAVIVQAFINVEGIGERRADLVRDFYDRAGEGAKQDSYPTIVAGSMTSLQEAAVIGNNGTALFTEAVQQTISSFSELQQTTAARERFQMPKLELVLKKSEELRIRYSSHM